MFAIEKLRTAAVGALMIVLPAALPNDAAAQMHDPDAPSFVVLNESLHELRVYAYEEDEKERVLLGWVGSDELEHFSVPADVVSMTGEYRVAIQQITPLPQIGVSAEPNPILSTPVVDPEPGETLRIVVDDQLELSQAVVR